LGYLWRHLLSPSVDFQRQSRSAGIQMNLTRSSRGPVN
jgi:hypothetical protein